MRFVENAARLVVKPFDFSVQLTILGQQVLREVVEVQILRRVGLNAWADLIVEGSRGGDAQGSGGGLPCLWQDVEHSLLEGKLTVLLTRSPAHLALLPGGVFAAALLFFVKGFGHAPQYFRNRVSHSASSNFSRVLPRSRTSITGQTRCTATAVLTELP